MGLLRALFGVTAAAAVSLGAVAASAQDKKVRIQMQSNFASTLALLGPNANYTVDQIKKLSAGSIDIKFFEPGALVPASQAFDSMPLGRRRASGPARTSPSRCSRPCRSAPASASTLPG
jgi:TRAP-type mannitol/chloroaromatic compound transport system substrate-binding protein